MATREAELRSTSIRFDKNITLEEVKILLAIRYPEFKGTKDHGSTIGKG